MEGGLRMTWIDDLKTVPLWIKIPIQLSLWGLVLVVLIVDALIIHALGTQVGWW